MKYINQILITLGALAFLAMCAFFWFSIQTSHFEAQAKPFAIEYITKLSERWSFSDVDTKSTPEFLSMVKSYDGNRTIQIFKQFGTLVGIKEFQAVQKTISFGETQGVYQFKASFANAKTVGLIEIYEINGQLQVQGLRFNVIESLPIKDNEFSA
ncbi:MAG: hypothetical protein ABW170_09130 [Candidatus Thiodiazotropha sp. L084R]